MSKDWSGGSTREWRRKRLKVLRQYKYVCQLRIDGICKYRADCVHHLKGKRFGDDMAYLVASCTPCNLHVGDPNAPRPATPAAPTHIPRDPEPRPSTLL